MPTENGDYQLFGPTTVSTETATDLSVYQISPEEIENIKKKQVYVRLSMAIEKYLQENKEDSYHLTKYTLLVLDEVQCEVYIYYDYHDDPPYSYYYKIFSKNIEIDYEPISSTIEKDFMIYESASFTNAFSLLKQLKIVETTYKFLDYYLLSPEKMEEAKAQREFIPLSQDKVCSVCYELTIEYTTCKHSICLKCRDKCIIQGKTRCPICRGSDLNIYPNIL